MTVNVLRVLLLDALLSEFFCEPLPRLCAAAISGFGLRAGIWACRHVPPRPITPPRTVSRVTSDDDRLTWAAAGPDCRTNNYQQGQTMLTRRHLIASAVAAPAILRFGTGTAHAATTLKISHQFPGGTLDKGDFRDRLCRMFAAEVAKRIERRDRRRNLSELVADQDQCAVLGDAQGRARYQPLSDALCRRRSAGDQYRPDAGPGRDLRPGHALEERAGRQGADRLPRRQGHHSR